MFYHEVPWSIRPILVTTVSSAMLSTLSLTQHRGARLAFAHAPITLKFGIIEARMSSCGSFAQTSNYFTDDCDVYFIQG